jgi:tetratricopeptide (TPR) repeat protein
VVALISVTAPAGLGHVGPDESIFSLAEAEERLSLGRAGESVDLYREAFGAASDLTSKLALGGFWARALLINQELDGWLETTRTEGWEGHLVRSVAFQYLGDLSAAQDEVSTALAGGAPSELRSALLGQRITWAQAVGDRERELALYRSPEAENDRHLDRRDYVEALLEVGAHAELEDFVAGHSSQLVAEVEFWRSLLPEMSQAGRLDAVSVHLERAWGGDLTDPGAVFALAELRLFQGRVEEAVDLFWTVFELKEKEGDGRPYFQRMNAFFYNRFPVKYRLDQATGHYGSEVTRDFALFGFHSDVQVLGTATARDVALQYLRELLVPAQATGVFLDRVREALDRSGAPAGARILAFAGLGAPLALLQEIETFVQSDEVDSAAAEFSLQAMNRYLLSSAKFPQIAQPLADLTRSMNGKFEAGRSAAARAGPEELAQRILLRLGEPREVVETAERTLEDYFEQIGAAGEAGQLEEAEELFRKLLEQAPGEDFGNVRLFLASLWQAEGNHDRAAERVAEVLQPILNQRAGPGLGAPLAWDLRLPFPPPNSYLGESGLEVIQNVLQVVAVPESRLQLNERLVSQYQSGGREQAALPLVLASILWWAGDRAEAIEWLGEVADSGTEAELQVLLGYLWGLEGRYATGREVLEAVPAESNQAREASRRLLFAFAVAEGEAERVAERARELETWIDRPSDRLMVAAGLVSVGLGTAAVGWLDRVSAAELGELEEERFQHLRLQVMLATGETEQAAAQSRFILLGTALDYLPSSADSLRRAALETLRETGDLEDYGNHLRALLRLAPRSLALHLLLGELADFAMERETRVDVKNQRREDALHFYREAVGLRPDDLDLRLDFCEWLGNRRLYREAVVEYQTILQRNVQEVLIDFSTVLAVFAQAGELVSLVEFFDRWTMPEVRAMDDFYGLQPTEHLMRPLGEALLAQGNQSAAARAWENGLRLNPIGFTEQIRLGLAAVYRDEGRMEALLELVRGYVTESNADPQFYAIQPFSSVAPRWIERANAAGSLETAPVSQLISAVEEAGWGRELRNRAAEWGRAMPDNVSAAAFAVYLSALADEVDWREQAVMARDKFAREGEHLRVTWDRVEELFQRVEGAEAEGRRLR